MKQFVCESCGTKYKKWSGRCEACGAWNSVGEDSNVIVSDIVPSSAREVGKIDFVDLNQQIAVDVPRISTGINELDRVLGGGIVTGSVILIGGEPGIGKSTLILQMCANLAKKEIKTVYVSGEESISQIALRAKRLNIDGKANISLVANGSIAHVMQEVIAMPPLMKPQIMVVDSIQTMFISNIESTPGTVNQIRATAMELISFAKKHHIAVLLVGHVTKEGQIAGPKLLEHMVDVVTYFEGDNALDFRILRNIKNRFGSVNEIGIFSMQSDGLAEVANPSQLFMSGVKNANGGNIFVAIEGTRPVITEIESLVTQSYLPAPRRTVIGWDNNRLAMIIAILQNKCKLSLHVKDIYLGVAGGFKINDPANDLAVAASIIKSYFDLPTKDMVFFGEITLNGQVRNISLLDIRIKEANKLGYEYFVLPKNAENIVKNHNQIKCFFVQEIGDLLKLIKPS